MSEYLNYNDDEPPRDEVNDDGDIVPYQSPIEPPDLLPPDQWAYEQANSEYVARLAVDAPEPPIAVSLVDRAQALEDIMAFYNKRNMTRGSEKQLKIPDSDFRKRYEDPEAVQQGAVNNTEKLKYGFVRGVSILAAVDAMRANGIHESDVEVAYISAKVPLNEQFLDWRATAAKRDKVVKLAKQAAKNITNTNT